MPKPGQPKKYTPSELETLGEQYFEDCIDNKVPFTITGLALALNFYGRQQLYEYREYPEFSSIIKSFMSRVEMGYEMGLHTPHTSGHIFALKNMGWKDNQEVKVQGPASKEEVDLLKDEIKKLVSDLDV